MNVSIENNRVKKKYSWKFESRDTNESSLALNEYMVW